MAQTSDLLPEPDRDSSAVMADDVFLFPASFGQQRLWFLDQWESGSAVYNIPSAYRLKGPLQVGALQRSLLEIVRRHEVLRTTFASHDGVPMQLVSADVEATIAVVDLSAHPDAEAKAVMAADASAQEPFDLARGPLLRVLLFRIAPDDHLLLIAAHHIVFDGWSQAVLLQELASGYGAFIEGLAPPLPELPIQYADFAVWQREALSGVELDRHLAYWKTRLAGLVPLELPLDHPRPKMQTYRGAMHPVTLAPDLVAALTAVGLREKATFFMTLSAAFEALLFRYTGQPDIALGIPMAGRGRAELEGLIGFFVNTIVLRTELSGDPSFLELVGRVRESALGAFAHQDVPFERLVEEVQPARDLSRSPLFQVLLAVQELRTGPVRFAGLTVAPTRTDWRISKFDLSLYLDESGGGFSGFFEYNTALFEPETIARLAEHFEILLNGIVANPDAPLSALPLLSPDEQRRVQVEWNRTESTYPSDCTLIDLIESQAVRTPSAIAVSQGEIRVTYRDLVTRGGRIASRLRRAGVKPGTLVGVCVDRSPAMVEGLLGILKAGGTYLPLDPAFPPERLAFMLADSKASVLLTETRLLGLLPGDQVEVVCLDALGEADAALACVSATPDDLAYVLYTSGSTGKPKGVEISHRSLVNFLWSMREVPGCVPDDILLAVTTLSFDIAGLELFLPLIVGARVELASRQVASDGRLLRTSIDRVRPTIFQATPATWRMLIEAGWAGTSGLKALIGGEPLPADLVAPLLGRTASLWNMYGPTETTIWSSVQQVTTPDADITVGRPIANTTFYVLDAARQPVPIGVAGELFIGGVGLAAGYRGRPELTAERFIPDPFSAEAGARLYRTGDLARFRADGQVVHLGRLDHQVKIRGFRIELGEIEATLSLHPSVAQAVVIVREDRPGDKRLVAYVVPGQPAPAVSDLREFLRGHLPDYMVPTAFVPLDALPLTPNGKVDRRALPLPTLDLGPGNLIEPRTDVERALATIWADVLGVTRVGVEDSFFDLGGHSLQATQLIARVEETFRVEVPLRGLFETPTIAGLAATIAQRTAQSDGEDEKLASLLAELEGLSADEVQSLLADPPDEAK